MKLASLLFDETLPNPQIHIFFEPASHVSPDLFPDHTRWRWFNVIVQPADFYAGASFSQDRFRCVIGTKEALRTAVKWTIAALS
ncbi:hypothetical protein [Ralstonia chuxiongensis]|uniref:hypothetical protein n=1 Tax=Ralstonia chuxiongensis TaxID=2957504 RepID=UPI002930408A|nr:hypothetical protein [Ralstonia chuxiongensis]